MRQIRGPFTARRLSMTDFIRLLIRVFGLFSVVYYGFSPLSSATALWYSEKSFTPVSTDF